MVDMVVANAAKSADYSLDIHPDEMTIKQLKYQMVIFRMAYKELNPYKYNNAADLEEAKAILVEAHDELFVRLCESSERFKRAVKSGKHKCLGGHSLENRNKYLKLAGLPVTEIPGV